MNRDALIPREDFVVKRENTTPSSVIDTVQIRDFEKNSFLYPQLRKPDFQRETSEWDEFNVTKFIRSFLEGDLIPSVIFWEGSYI